MSAFGSCVHPFVLLGGPPSLLLLQLRCLLPRLAFGGNLRPSLLGITIPIPSVDQRIDPSSYSIRHVRIDRDHLHPLCDRCRLHGLAGLSGRYDPSTSRRKEGAKAIFTRRHRDISYTTLGGMASPSRVADRPDLGVHVAVPFRIEWPVGRCADNSPVYAFFVLGWAVAIRSECALLAA